MKKTIVSLILFVTSSIALGACPAYAPYNCVQGFNGKMICGCGVR